MVVFLLNLCSSCCGSAAFSNFPIQSPTRFVVSRQGRLFKSISKSENKLSSKIAANSIPKHVAFICDGNSRWALARGMPACMGHAAGADRLMECLETMKSYGVEYCTLYGFSTENWKRSDEEIKDILAVIEHTANVFKHRALKENVRVKVLGNIHDPRLPNSLKIALSSLERETYEASNAVDRRLTVCLAINFGGRQDILQASLALAKAISTGEIDPSQASENDIARLLYTADIPDPDFVIRTGGDQRLSNFLLWNLAYSELYFTDVLWPDLDRTELMKAMTWFSTRSRRFGGRVEGPSTHSQTLR